MTHPVLNCEEQRRMAMNNTDLDAFRQFCDPAMIYRHSTGAIDDLTQYIGKLESKQVKYSNVVFKDMSVIVPESGDICLQMLQSQLKISKLVAIFKLLGFKMVTNGNF